MAKIDDPAKCPACSEPNIHPSSTTGDGLRFRRCPRCLNSWFTRVKPKTDDTH